MEAQVAVFLYSVSKSASENFKYFMSFAVKYPDFCRKPVPLIPQHKISNPYSGINKSQNIIFNYLAAPLDWPPTTRKQKRSESHEHCSTGFES